MREKNIPVEGEGGENCEGIIQIKGDMKPFKI